MPIAQKYEILWSLKPEDFFVLFVLNPKSEFTSALPLSAIPDLEVDTNADTNLYGI